MLPKAFTTLWERIEPELSPEWDMTERQFYLRHSAYPDITVHAPSDALVLMAYYNALKQHLYNM